MKPNPPKGAVRVITKKAVKKIHDQLRAEHPDSEFEPDFIVKFFEPTHHEDRHVRRVRDFMGRV